MTPAQFPSPFDALGPHPLARQAAEALQAELRAGRLAPGVATSTLEGPEGGKMFGVLVVCDASGRRSTLKAFSGLLAGAWEHDGWVPPAFDAAARAALERPGEATVKALTRRRDAFAAAPPLGEARESLAALRARHAQERDAQRAAHRENQRQRGEARARLEAAEAGDPDARVAALHALDQESRRDKAERRRLEGAQAQERVAPELAVRRLERRLAAHDRLRRWSSSSLMRRLHDTYVLQDSAGNRRTLRSLHAPGEPPSGAGDCAAPKLLAHAIARGLRPLALAEFWWGAPPPGGGRVAGAFYPACQAKCGAVLPFLLGGLDVAEPRRFSPAPRAPLELEVIHEDPWIVAVAKPHGLLSVPGRGEDAQDSVLTRLRARFPAATGPLLVHRLDLDTSGLLLAARDERTHAALQQRFLRREIEKRYVALLDGVPGPVPSPLCLALRPDLHDRPRQIHDPVHGREAVTGWELLALEGGRARVALFPRTGRTHQLRVHAAHPLGLGCPIVGDRLYGREETRLMLHAEALAFVHPSTGRRLALEVPAPF